MFRARTQDFADYELSLKSRKFRGSHISDPKMMSLKIKNIVQSKYALFVHRGVTNGNLDTDYHILLLAHFERLSAVENKN